MTVLVTILAAAAAATASATDLKAADGAYLPPQQTDPRFWLGPDDYPSDVFRDGGQGAVGFRLYIDPKGKPYRCEVYASSGWAGLDKTTCMGALKNGRFIPARDDSGQPAFGRISRIQNWVNPNVWAKQATPLPPFETMLHTDRVSFNVELNYIAEADGKISRCRVDDETLPKVLAELACDEFMKARAEPPTDSNGLNVRSVMTSRIAFTTGAVSPPPASGAVYARNK